MYIHGYARDRESKRTLTKVRDARSQQECYQDGRSDKRDAVHDRVHARPICLRARADCGTVFSASVVRG